MLIQKPYKISLKAKSGNTVAFINFSENFLRAVLNKSPKHVTMQDIQSINKGNVVDYLNSLEISVEEVNTTAIDATEY